MLAGPAAVILLTLYVVGSFLFFTVLVVQSFKPRKYPSARAKVAISLLLAAALVLFGAYWWSTNFPAHFSIRNIVIFCLLPGLGLGAICSEVAFRLSSRYFDKHAKN